MRAWCRPRASSPREPGLSSVEEWLWRHSYAYAWLARTGGFGPQSVRLEDLIYVEGYADLYQPVGEGGVNREGVAAFLRNIDDMLVLARARGVEVLLTTFPMRGGPGAQVGGQDFSLTVAVMNRQLADDARQQGVPLADFAGALDERRELFQDQIHLNAEGAALQAELALQAARAAGLWGLSP
jgi:hypothetical protein